MNAVSSAEFRPTSKTPVLTPRMSAYVELASGMFSYLTIARLFSVAQLNPVRRGIRDASR